MKWWTLCATMALPGLVAVACGSDDQNTTTTVNTGGAATTGGQGGDGGNPSTGGGGSTSMGGGGAGGGIPPACSDMVDTALAFLDLLEDDEHTTATADFGSAEHQAFEFLPPMNVARDGLTMKDMDDEEQMALQAFLQAAYSASGYMKLEAIRALESVLAQQEAGMPVTPNRDPENYFIQFFGTPTVEGDLPWGFRFTGHHLSLHGAVIACSVFSATPAFWGASPEVTPLQAEVDAGEALFAALDAGQQATAEEVDINGEAITSKSGLLAAISPEGVRAGDMTAAQVTLLRQLIGTYLDNMAAPIAADRLEALEAAGFDDISFGYDNGEWRVMGPTFMIEFQYAGADHIHSVWRDYDGDYGDDLIAQHMSSVHHD